MLGTNKKADRALENADPREISHGALRGLEGFGREAGLFKQAQQQTALHLAGVHRDDQANAGGMVEDEMAAGLMIDGEARSLQFFGRIPSASRCRGGTSGGQGDGDGLHDFPRLHGKGFAVLLEAGAMRVDGVLDHLFGFLQRLALGLAAGQGRNLEAIFPV